MKRLIPILLAAACVQPPPPPPIMPGVPSSARMALRVVDGEQPRPMGLVLRTVASAPSYRIVYPPQMCVVANGRQLPFLSCGGEGPVVGMPWRLSMWTRADPVNDTEMCWLMVGWGPLPTPIDYTAWGMPGCHLLVQPEWSIPIANGTSDGLIVRQGGRAVLTWVPTADVLGQTVSFQLLVHAPGANQFGLVGSPALSATIGN